MSADEKRMAKEKVVSLFYHAYNAYMDNAYPADELMPLSCKGRYRGSEPSRGDVDDSLGNFTLTLIDSVDTLAVLGDVEGFEEAVRNIIRDARFDCDVIVSVFETNIRILGGLLGGHVMASYFKRRGMGLSWYNDDLLSRAKEVGDRLLPAFNTSTGIPYPRINLKHGIVPQISSSHRDTCTACAGSMILEFAALSRLTGIPIYEEKARRAMDYLWQQRHRGSDLMGTIINVHSGDWIRRESGVGAGIDSYYEYVLKAYVLLGDDNYLHRFNKHYDAVMRYMSQGPLLLDVHMHKPNSISRNFMDALLAFWPGLQVLKGDLVPAIETHEMLYHVMQRHNFIPEAFTTDFRVHWGNHPLRPEFIESTYFLYKATGDHYYLEAGKKVLDNLETHAKVDCGLAAIKNVKTGAHEDQMDSYVLAEMFKYLYLLFTEQEDLAIDIDDFIFTTEAHLLPLTLSVGNSTPTVPKIRPDAYNFEVDLSRPVSDNYVTRLGEEVGGRGVGQEEGAESEEEGDHTCPAIHTTHASGSGYPHTVRSLIKNIVNRVSPHTRNRGPRLKAGDFIAGNKEQLDQLHAMGIRIATMADGRIQLLHTASEAHSPADAEDGMQFMQEMIELSKHQQPEAQHDPMFIHVTIPGLKETEVIRAGPAQFGYDLKDNTPVTGMLAVSRPYRACKEMENVQELAGHIVILERGDCMFVDKARNLQRIGAIGGIVIDHTEGSTSESQPLFAMSGDGTNDVDIPMLFLYHSQGQQLLHMLEDNSFLQATLSASSDPQPPSAQRAEQATATGPQGVDPSSGRTGETEPLPLLHQQPHLPSPHDDTPTPLAQGEEREGDAFTDHVMDKFYHHEAQLRDLYYLQVGSHYLHVNVEVRPSAVKPAAIESRPNTFSLDALPDGSKMVTARLSYLSPGYERNKPALNQMYMDTVHLLQLHTNLNHLPHTTDYLRALARCLEAGYFGMSRVDSDALTLLRGLSRQLQYVHRYPSQPDRPDPQSPQSPDSATTAGHTQGTAGHTQGTAGHTGAEKSSNDVDRSYAGAEDFTESAPHTPSDKSSASTQDSGGEGQGQRSGVSEGQYVRGEREHGARVGEGGALEIVGETRMDVPAQRETVTGDSGDGVAVKPADSDHSISQSQSSDFRDSQSQGLDNVDQSVTSSDSQSASSRQSGSQTSSSGVDSEKSGASNEQNKDGRPNDEL
ncbi:hypothetical protein V1264_024679 [Littorina saxatilis]|uniref:alpha-1,2-Mannosidase n=2 Tax=Littorina saxatilis TaxID=31220 RepID=A0AAN9AMN4_9CAEN